MPPFDAQVVLGLDDEKRDKLNTLLLDRQMAMAESGLELLENGDDGKIDLGSAEDLVAEKSEHDEKLRELLGEEDFSTFDLFEKSTAERDELASFRSLLEENGQELSFETEQQLMEIMYEANHSMIDDVSEASEEMLARLASGDPQTQAE